jgi:tetratricopeptide (TPR) repeat protein
MHDYDARDLKRLFGLSAASVRALVRAGHVRPVMVAAGLRYSFQDLVVFRAVKALRAAHTPVRGIYRELRRLRGGQYALPLEVATVQTNIGWRSERERAMHSVDEAHQHFLRALELEDADEAAARSAYLACIAVDAQHAEARINLGRLLHLAGQMAEAERVYRECGETSALLSFNLALVLEDQAREPEAILAYRDAIAHDPAMADAHFNIARLHERAGEPQASFRHLLAYRRLLDQTGT